MTNMYKYCWDAAERFIIEANTLRAATHVAKGSSAQGTNTDDGILPFTFNWAVIMRSDLIFPISEGLLFNATFSSISRPSFEPMRLPHDTYKLTRNWGRMGVKQRLLQSAGVDVRTATKSLSEAAELRESDAHAA